VTIKAPGSIIEKHCHQNYTDSFRGRCVLKISPELFRIISSGLRAKLIKTIKELRGMEEF
jgi:hypothetical protein